MPEDEQQLVEQAELACSTAHAPYSNFHVGAAALLESGRVVIGSNQESEVYPAGICAERNAMFHAVAEGHTKFRRIVIAGKSHDFCVPCGMCRQVMREFCGDDFKIYMVSPSGYEEATMAQLLPFSFSNVNMTE